MKQSLLLVTFWHNMQIPHLYVAFRSIKRLVFQPVSQSESWHAVVGSLNTSQSWIFWLSGAFTLLPWCKVHILKGLRGVSPDSDDSMINAYLSLLSPPPPAHTPTLHTQSSNGFKKKQKQNKTDESRQQGRQKAARRRRVISVGFCPPAFWQESVSILLMFDKTLGQRPVLCVLDDTLCDTVVGLIAQSQLFPKIIWKEDSLSNELFIFTVLCRSQFIWEDFEMENTIENCSWWRIQLRANHTQYVAKTFTTVDEAQHLTLQK